MEVLWVFDASTTELIDKLSSFLAQHSSTHHSSHLVQTIQEELQERACHTEVEQLLQQEVKLEQEQEHGAHSHLQHAAACCNNAAGADYAAGSSQPRCSSNQHVIATPSSPPHQSSQQQLAVHYGTSAGVAMQPGGQQSAHILQKPTEIIQQLAHVGPHELDFADIRQQQEEQHAMQQGVSAAPQQQQQALPASLAPLQAAQQAFLEEQQRIRKAKMALHKPQRIHGRPAAVKKLTVPNTIRAAQQHPAQQQTGSLQQLLRHSPQACEQQHDKWHTVNCSQSAVRHAAQHPQLKQQQRPAEGMEAAGMAAQPSAALPIKEHISSASFRDVSGPYSSTPLQAGEQAKTEGLASVVTAASNSAAEEASAPAPAHDRGNADRSTVAVTNAVGAVLIEAAVSPAVVIASIATASHDSTEAGLAAPAAVAGTAHGPSFTAEAVPAAAGATAMSCSATETHAELQQAALLTTFRESTAGDTAVVTAAYSADNGAGSRALQEDMLPGGQDMFPGCQASAAVLASCSRKQCMAASAEQVQQHVRLDLQEPMAASDPADTLHSQRQADLALLHLTHSDMLMAPPPLSQQQQQQPAFTPAEAAVQQGTSATLVADCQAPDPAGLVAWQPLGEPCAAFELPYMAVYNCITGRADVHQPLQLDSWRDWDAMASVDDSHDGFGAWGAAKD